MSAPEMTDAELAAINPAWVAERAAFKAHSGSGDAAPPAASVTAPSSSRLTDAELGPTLAAARAEYEARPPEGPAPTFIAAPHFRTRAQLADLSREILAQAQAELGADFNPNAPELDEYYKHIAAAEPELPALPEGYTWDPDQLGHEEACAAKLDVPLSQVRWHRNRIVRYVHGVGRPDGAETDRRLVARYGADLDTLTLAAHPIYMALPQSWRDVLDDTGVDYELFVDLIETARERGA